MEKAVKLTSSSSNNYAKYSNSISQSSFKNSSKTPHSINHVSRSSSKTSQEIRSGKSKLIESTILKKSSDSSSRRHLQTNEKESFWKDMYREIIVKRTGSPNINLKDVRKFRTKVGGGNFRDNSLVQQSLCLKSKVEREFSPKFHKEIKPIHISETIEKNKAKKTKGLFAEIKAQILSKSINKGNSFMTSNSIYTLRDNGILLNDSKNIKTIERKSKEKEIQIKNENLPNFNTLMGKIKGKLQQGIEKKNN